MFFLITFFSEKIGDEFEGHRFFQEAVYLVVQFGRFAGDSLNYFFGYAEKSDDVVRDNANENGNDDDRQSAYEVEKYL
jgi:hypothetical protein